jgi:TANFOR domain-containing protein
MFLLFNDLKRYGSRFLWLMILLLYPVLSKSQNSVTVNATVFPPYSTKLSYYIDNPNKIQVFFVNISGQPLDVYVQGNLTGDNGIEIKTDPAYHPPVPITLQPGVPFYLTPDNLGDVFSADHLLYTGITENELLNMKGLPEGNYNFCFRVYDFNTGKLLSDENSGCSNSFVIKYIDPPVILSPVCGDSITALTPQNVIISWSVPVGAGPNVKYRFIMTEMHPEDRNPNDALNSASPPYFIEEETSIPQLLIGPSYPPLMPGRAYAFRVQAFDPDNKVVFNNDGVSEACWFIYKSMKLPHFNWPPNDFTQVPVLKTPQKGAVIRTKSPTFSWFYNKGENEKVHFRIVVVPTYLNQSYKKAIIENTPVYEEIYNDVPDMFAPVNSLDLQDNAIYAWQVQVLDDSTGKVLEGSKIWSFTYKKPNTTWNWGGGGWNMFSSSTVSGTLLYEFADPGEYTGKPLKNAHVRLVVHYVMKYSQHESNNGNTDPATGSVFVKDAEMQALGYNDNGKVLATGITDDNGHFSFTFFSSDSSNVVIRKGYLYKESWNNAGEFYNTYQGDIYRVYRLEFDETYSPYYLNPDKDITVQPDETVDVGNIFAYVRSYALTVTIKPTRTEEQQFTHVAIPNMHVYLIRRNRPYIVPSDEGKPRPAEAMTMKGGEVIAVGTTNEKGQVTFKRLVKNVLPDDKYYIWAESDPEIGKENYKMLIPYGFRFNFDEEAHFGSEYKYPYQGQTVYAFPQLPEIAGKVVRGDVGQPLTQAHVELWANILAQERGWHTYSDGKFKFTKLKVNYNDEGKISGPVRHLYIHKPGYVERHILVKGRGLNYALVKGEKWHDYNITLDPAMNVTGQVVNEEGLGVMAKVTLVGGLTVNTAPGSYDFVNHTFKPSTFSVPSPSGPQQLIIDPTPFYPDYFPDTLNIEVTNGTYDVGKVILSRKTHKLRLFVYVVPPGDGFINPGSEEKLPGAVVKLQGQNGNLIEQKTADQNGMVEFEFLNAAQDFLITVESPSPEVDIEKRTVALTIPETKGFITKRIYVSKAAKVAGYVYVGTNNNPVSGAHVFLEYSGQNGDLLDTYTDANGHFVLHNVPVKNYQTFSAAKSQTNTIGDHITLNVTEEGADNLEFHLKIYKDMDITHLLGFPIEVTTLNVTGDQVFISGNIIKLDSLKNDLFSTQTQYVGFSNVEINKGSETTEIFGNTVPVALPKSLPLKTNVNTLNLDVYNAFAAVLNDSANGIRIKKITEKNGVFEGEVFVTADNFSIPNHNLRFKNDKIYLKSPSAEEMTLPTITSDLSKPFDAVAGIPVVSGKNDDLEYQLYGYDATAKKDDSFISGNMLKLQTTLHTNIQNITPADLAVNVGKVNIKKDEIETVSGGESNPLKLKLDNWEITGNAWSLNGYLTINKGILHTGVVDVPITEMIIKKDALSQGKFNLTDMKLAGTVPIHILGKPVLDFDNANKYWFLFVGKGENEYSSYLSDLPGMVSGDRIKINNFSLTSKGGKDFSPVYGQLPVTVYKVGKLSANSIESFYDYVEISGLSFDIPGFSQITSVRYLKGDDGQPKFKMVPFTMNLKAKGVNMDFGVNEEEAKTQKLDDFGLIAKGKTYEIGKFELVTWLYHTVDSTSIWVETSPWQTLPIGENNTYFSKVTGSMHVANGDWTNFRFAGDMTGTKGVTDEHKRMDFIVKGEIEANGQEIGLKNIDTPFGNMSWTYEFENSRLIGTLSFDENIGGTRIVGDAQTIVDPKGWYFVASGKTNIPGLGELHSGMLFGDYPYLPQTVKDVFAANSYKKSLPATFNTKISGFLFSGAVAVPVIVPNVDIDLILVKARFGIDAGGDARLWMSFDDSGNEYGIGFLGFLHAYMTLPSLPTCTVVDGDAKAESGVEGKYQTSNGTFTISGCYSFGFKVLVKQEIWVPTQGCALPYVFDKDFNIAFKADMYLDSDGNKGFEFALGNCSD